MKRKPPQPAPRDPTAPRRGRPPALDTVRVYSIGMAKRGTITTERPSLVFEISNDLIEELFRIHDLTYAPFLYGALDKPDRYKAHRLQFVRFRDIGIPGALIRVEPPTYDPHGARLWKPNKGACFRTQVLARKLRVLPGIPRQHLEHFIDDTNLKGLVVTFRDEDMEYPGEKVRLTVRARPIPVNDQDLGVRTHEGR